MVPADPAIIMRGRNKTMRLILMFVIAFGLTGCQTAYYGAMEKVGIHKREILVDRIEETQESQEEAKEQFSSALEQFASVVHFDGGDLEEIYNRLNDEFEDSEARAQEVRDRIDAVESVADALFSEWEDELEQYSNPDLKRSSKRQLNETQRSYSKLLAAMQRASRRMDPVLTTFGDQVLFLKHNLNARAISSIENELGKIEADVEVLIREMNRAIEEAGAFVATLRS
jgi:uncharacterized protein YdiU (UPF0061 family)